jgi:hypothetical protein
MIAERIIKVTDGNTWLTLTNLPYSVQSTDGFDTMNVKNITSQGYRQDGETLLGSSVSSRSLTISGQILAYNAKEMEQLRLTLINMFRPKANLTLWHTYGGEKKSITARVSKTPKIELTGVSRIQNYRVDLQASMPYWEDPATVARIADTIGSFHFPAQTPTEFGRRMASKIVTLNNASQDTIGLTIRFIAHGIVENPQVINVYTREFIQINATMTQNEIITIDTEKKTIQKKLNGEITNYLSKIDLAGGGYTFLRLNPGDNVLRALAESGESMLETQISYKNRFPGV